MPTQSRDSQVLPGVQPKRLSCKLPTSPAKKEKKKFSLHSSGDLQKFLEGRGSGQYPLPESLQSWVRGGRLGWWRVPEASCS